eukprot:GEMP01017574.1.p1 GENE.GEMP01017574.1~~GEMP01017574.1.p1  ORF type:complete len:585 (+),score=93.95 GEMP01017574.1:84-1838(+)
MIQYAQRQNFHSGRWRCIWNPQRARDVLTPYSVLHIRVRAARGLLAKDHGMLSHSSDPYYEIYVNDKVYHVSDHVGATLHPVFDHHTISIPIWHPLSIVNVKLMDWENALKRLSYGNEILGFVEFKINDLPINEEVSGWFELRLEDFLVGTANTRVKEHSELRDDMAYDRPEAATVIETRERQANAWCGCAATMPGALRRSANIPNAGSVLLELTLEVANNSKWDEFYAYALPKPKFDYHQKRLVTRNRDLPELDVEELVVNGTFIGDTLWKNGGMCIIDSIKYILTWQECWISLIFTAGWVVMVLYPRFALGIFVASIAFWLLLLWSPRRRARMVANPLSAPFNDDGFYLVATLRNTRKMANWIERVIVQLLHGVINNYPDLEIFAGGVFRDGEPLMSFMNLVRAIKEEKIIIDPYASTTDMSRQADKPQWHTLPDHAFALKSKVVVSQFGRAETKGQITSHNSNGTYGLHLTDGTNVKGVPEDALSDDPAGAVPNIPAWLIPDSIEDAVRGMQPVVSNVKEQVGGFWESMHRLLTWQNTGTNLGIVLVLLVIAVLLGMAGNYLTLASDKLVLRFTDDTSPKE